MPSISRLPDSATRLLCSHVVVVTPVSLVKELLENSIDAKATSVEILVSPDTISKIEIRDDGVGIHPDDYDALGRRGHTSKLRSIDELGDAVRETLGFRGEALASVNCLADVTITTKTSTEPVAAILQLIPDEGGILKQRSTSAPVGTTVRVTKLFSRQPVREQMAIKEAKKNIEKMQELLRSYAMARPQLRLSFKVLHTPTKIWSYSPRPGATVAEAALQLFGVEAASNCLLKTIQSDHGSTDNDPTAQGLLKSATDGFRLEALLANPEAEHQKVPNRHYFSVDSRPINSRRGITKKLLKVYIEHLKTSMPAMRKDVTDSFIHLNVCCPSGSYDANIEPSKDNVLFTDENVILDTFRRLCDEIYKPPKVGDGEVLSTINARQTDESISNTEGQDYQQKQHPHSSSADCSPEMSRDILKIFPGVSGSNPRHPVDQPAVLDEPACSKAVQRTQNSNKFTPINANNSPACLQLLSPISSPVKTNPALNQLTVDMPVEVNEGLERSRQQPQQGVERSLSPQATTIPRECNAVGLPNPWTIAKMNGPSGVSPPRSDMALGLFPRSPEPPLLRHIRAPPGDLDVPRTQQAAKRTGLPGVQRSTVPGGSFRSPVARASDGQRQSGPNIPLPRSHMAPRRQQRREQPPWTPPSSLERNQNRDACQPIPDHPQGANAFKQTTISFDGTQAKHRQVESQDDNAHTNVRSGRSLNVLAAESHSNVQSMFSTARQNLQYQLSQTNGNQSQKTNQDGECQPPYKQPARQRQAFGTLRTNSIKNSETPKDLQEPLATSLPSGDPRAYLLRRQKSMAAEETGARPRKLRRLKSCLMPLENIPPEYQTHNLSCPVSLDGRVLDELVQEIRKYDEYVIYGALIDGIDMNLADGREIEGRLQKLLINLKGNVGGDENSETMVDLQGTLKGKGTRNELTA
ncbi:hypothetical protein GGR50DRAFT_184494 [Xylaria sp. CBS 124048]|nr:hypothetical protein GGR50DRAFT_184494 [Xylaria sp. CBS 124048]